MEISNEISSNIFSIHLQMIVQKYCLARLRRLVPSNPGMRGLAQVLDKLLLLYSLSCLEKHLATLYQGNYKAYAWKWNFDSPTGCSYVFLVCNAGGYCEGPQMADLLRESILLLCEELKPEAVGIADALAPPDFVLNSILGQADGKVRRLS